MEEYLPGLYQQFIYVSRYARWLEKENRRETWPETVDRYMNFMVSHLKKTKEYEVSHELEWELKEAILKLEILPSMRALMTAGPALERDNICGYNCAYLPVDSVRAFDEAVYILMNGTGVGFSVEKKYVDNLPIVAEEFYDSETTIIVGDSKAGWAGAYRELLAMLWAGQVPKWNTSAVREAGARLKIFGGRASGPKPLEDLFEFAVRLFRSAAGRQLTRRECHDLMCKAADIVVVGGVRRSAMISFSDLEDQEMAKAKNGAWWESAPYRRLANNSVAYEKKPSMEQFMSEWHNLYSSKSGERGIFNVEAAKKAAGRSGRRDISYDFRANPCSEIILRPNEFCNLSTVIIRETDTPGDLDRKVRLATILGTWQATLTNFKYIRRIWRKNTEEESLLGVSLNGTMGHKVLSGQKGKKELRELLTHLKNAAIDTNAQLAPEIGINISAAITCQKPEGTTSQLALTGSGGHAWHNDFYVRTVRGDKKDPLTAFLTDGGIPVEDDVMAPSSTAVFSFPIAAPKDALTRRDLSAIDQLEIWLDYQKYWCEHKPSITVNVKEHEWMKVGAWVYDHFDEMSGVSFLPDTDHVYKQAPYQDITEEEYNNLVKEMPKSIDWSILPYYEKEDSTTGTQTLACTGGSCELVDIGNTIKTESAIMA